MTEDKFFIVKEYIENGESYWHFDEYGNIVPKAKPDELPFDYQVPGHLYIKIKDFNFTQDNIIPVTCYSAVIYMYGKSKLVSTFILPATFQIYLYGSIDDIQNNFAYTDIHDCLSDALYLVNYFKEDLMKFFNDSQARFESALINLDKKGDIIEGIND